MTFSPFVERLRIVFPREVESYTCSLKVAMHASSLTNAELFFTSAQQQHRHVSKFPLRIHRLQFGIAPNLFLTCRVEGGQIDEL